MSYGANEIPEDFLRRVRTAQAWGDVNQKSLAEAVGLSVKTLYTHLRDPHTAAEHVPTIARTCSVSELFLVGYDDRLGRPDDKTRLEFAALQTSVAEALLQIEAARRAILQIHP